MLLNVLIGLLVIVVLVSIIGNIADNRGGNAKTIFLGKESTNALKGFAIIMIALAHI